MEHGLYSPKIFGHFNTIFAQLLATNWSKFNAWPTGTSTTPASFLHNFSAQIGQKFNARPTRTSITSASVLHNFSVKIQPIWPAKNFRSAFTASLDTASSPELAPPNLQDRPSFTHPARSSPTTLLISQSEYSTCLGVCKQNTWSSYLNGLRICINSPHQAKVVSSFEMF